MTKRKEVNPKIREIGLPVIFVFVVIALIMIVGGLWYQGKGMTDVTPDIIISDPIVEQPAPAPAPIVEEAPSEEGVEGEEVPAEEEEAV